MLLPLAPCTCSVVVIRNIWGFQKSAFLHLSVYILFSNCLCINQSSYPLISVLKNYPNPSCVVLAMTLHEFKANYYSFWMLRAFFDFVYISSLHILHFHLFFVWWWLFIYIQRTLLLGCGKKICIHVFFVLVSSRIVCCSACLYIQQVSGVLHKVFIGKQNPGHHQYLKTMAKTTLYLYLYLKGGIFVWLV